MINEGQPDPPPDPLYDETIFIHEGPAPQGVADAIMNSLLAYMDKFISSERLRDEWMEQVKKVIDQCKYSLFHLKQLNYQIISQTIGQLLKHNKQLLFKRDVLRQVISLRLHHLWKAHKQERREVGRQSSPDKNLKSASKQGNRNEFRGSSQKKKNLQPFASLNPSQAHQPINHGLSQKLQQEFDQIKKQLKDVKRQLKKSKESQQKLQEKQLQHQVENSRLEEELAKSQKIIREQKIRRNSQKINSSLGSLSQKFIGNHFDNRLKQEEELKNKLLADHKREFAAFQAGAVEQIKSLATKLEKAEYSMNLKDAQMKKKQQEVGQLENIVSTKQQKIQQLKKISDDMEHKLNRDSGIINTMQKEIQELKEKHRQEERKWRLKFEQLQRKSKSQKIASDKRNEQVLQELRNQANNASANTINIKQELRAQGKLLEKAEKQRKRVVDELEQQRHQFERINAHRRRQLEDKEGKLERLTKEKNITQEELRDKLEEIDLLKEKLDKLARTFNNDIQSHDLAIRNHRRANQHLNEQIDRLQAELSKRSRDISGACDILSKR